MLGKKFSKETREKMSKAHKGLKPSSWGAGFKKGNIPWNKNATVDAYFAGLIDADGYISIQNNCSKKKDPTGRYKRVSIRVAMVDKEAIDEAQKRYGGWVYKRKPRKHNKSGYYEWVLQHKIAELFIRKIKPYLRIKKQQALIILKFRELQNRNRKKATPPISKEELEYRNSLVDKLKSLHLKKGKQTS